MAAETTFQEENPQEKQEERIEEFSTSLATIEVRIDKALYQLRELDGEGRGLYLDGIAQRVVINPDTGKPSSLKSFTGLETSLLSLCLYDQQDRLVDAKKMAKWPSTVLTKLFDKALNLSGLSELGKKQLQEKAKNA